jgi:hypothetical protein
MKKAEARSLSTLYQQSSSAFVGLLEDFPGFTNERHQLTYIFREPNIFATFHYASGRCGTDALTRRTYAMLQPCFQLFIPRSYNHCLRIN